MFNNFFAMRDEQFYSFEVYALSSSRKIFADFDSVRNNLGLTITSKHVVLESEARNELSYIELNKNFIRSFSYKIGRASCRERV